MALDYILVGLSVIGIAIQFSLQKLYQLKCGKTFVSVVFFSMMSGIVTCLFFLCLNGFRVAYSEFSLFMSLGLAFCMVLNTVMGIWIVSLGKISVFTLFMMFGGMLIPYLYGCIFLNEALTVGSVVGMFLLVGALFMPVLQKENKAETVSGKTKKKLFYILCCIVFLSNGCVSTISKVHQINQAAIPTNDFMVFLNLWVVMIGVILIVVSSLVSYFKKKREVVAADCDHVNEEVVLQFTERESIQGRNYRLWFALAIITIAALVSGTSQMLQLMGAQNIPATVLYPYITGGTVLLTSLAGYVFYKEKITWQIAVSLGLAVIGTVLFLF